MKTDITFLLKKNLCCGYCDTIIGSVTYELMCPPLGMTGFASEREAGGG